MPTLLIFEMNPGLIINEQFDPKLYDAHYIIKPLKIEALFLEIIHSTSDKKINKDYTLLLDYYKKSVFIVFLHATAKLLQIKSRRLVLSNL